MLDVDKINKVEKKSVEIKKWITEMILQYII